MNFLVIGGSLLAVLGLAGLFYRFGSMTLLYMAIPAAVLGFYLAWRFAKGGEWK